MKSPHRVRAALAWVALISACGGDTTRPAPHDARLLLSHLTRIVNVENQITIEAYLSDGRSNRLPTPPLRWSSDDAAIASVDANGVVTGNAVGFVTIRAAVGDIEGSIRIEVRPAALAIVWQEGPSTLLIGESSVFRAKFRSSKGTLLPVPENITWSTRDRNLVDLAPVPGHDASYVRVTGLATGLAAISVAVELKQSVEIVGVLPERPPDAAPLGVRDFYFFPYWDFGGYMPTMRVTVSPGRSVEMMRIEVSVPGMEPKELPSLCSNGRLAAGEYNLLALASYPVGALKGYSFYWVEAGMGSALLTYRTDEGRVIRTVVRGVIAAWNYDTGYPTQFPWQVCAT